MGVAVRGVMHAGGLVADEKVNALVVERLARPDAAQGFILDGYPRTRQQAEWLCNWLKERGIDELVIHLLVDYNSLIKRLTGRRQCPLCGTLYNLFSKPPKRDARLSAARRRCADWARWRRTRASNHPHSESRAPRSSS